MKRRDFINRTLGTGVALSVFGLYGFSGETDKKPFFKLSLAQWSLHRALYAKEMDNLEFAIAARNLGFEGLEYVNSFFKTHAKDKAYLNEMNNRARGEGVKNVLIMIDGEGQLADKNTQNRLKAIENHHKWVDAAHFLGCHAIRVNLGGGVDEKEAMKASVDSLNRLSDYAKGSGISILVENHGGFSSNGKWLSSVFKQVKNTNTGTLPDFGNFCIERSKNGCKKSYDRYLGLKEILPFAKAVSAKSYDFDSQGNETTIDYYKVLKMVKEVGYTGFIGVEYEGTGVSEEKGIELTRDLLIRIGKELA